jgi:uncharacterized protein
MAECAAVPDLLSTAIVRYAFATGSKMIARTTHGEQKDFRSSLAEYIQKEARPIDKFGHQPRLYALTELVGRGRKYDDDVVYAAAWLHDLGVFAGHRPEGGEALARWDNVRYAIEQAPAILRQVGFPEGKISAVLEAMRTHQPQRTPQTLEGTILRDADILEQLGAIGVLRTAAKIGRDTRYSAFGDAAAALGKALAELPGELSLESARILAEPRIALLRAFLKALEEEATGGLF